MTIDPSRDGCTIWCGGYVQFIHGTAMECCKRIIKSITDENGEQIYFDIILDTMGVGMAYADYFTENGIKFTKVKHKTIIK